MITIIDYGVGNLFSLNCSLNAIHAEAEITDDPERIAKADRIILPGVGAFGDAAEKLRKTGLDRIAVSRAAAGVPLLGICVGMQLLFERSYEFGVHEGLGLIPGTVRPIRDRISPELKIPQIGWNSLTYPNKGRLFKGWNSLLIRQAGHPLFRYVRNGDHVYFVHSYHAETDPKYLLAQTDYGGLLTAAVARENVMGCQFHPEKSGKIGLSILKAFAEM